MAVGLAQVLPAKGRRPQMFTKTQPVRKIKQVVLQAEPKSINACLNILVDVSRTLSDPGGFQSGADILRLIPNSGFVEIVEDLE